MLIKKKSLQVVTMLELDQRVFDVNAICAVTLNGKSLLAVSCLARSPVRYEVQLWEPFGLSTWERRAVLAIPFEVKAISTVMIGEQALLAICGGDGTVRLWDPSTGQERAVCIGHRGRVFGACGVTVGAETLLASASDDCTISLWDPSTGQERAVMNSSRHLTAICTVAVGRKNLLAVGGHWDISGKVRLWDPSTGREHAVMSGVHEGGNILAVCTVKAGGKGLLASAGEDGTVQLHDPSTGRCRAVLRHRTYGSVTVCAVKVGGKSLLASADQDTVRLWNPSNGRQRAVLEESGTQALCPLTVDGQTLLSLACTGVWKGTQCRLLLVSLLSLLPARVTALQLVYADVQGRWPWDKNFRGGRAGQPVLGPRTRPAA